MARIDILAVELRDKAFKDPVTRANHPILPTITPQKGLTIAVSLNL